MRLECYVHAVRFSVSFSGATRMINFDTELSRVNPQHTSTYRVLPGLVTERDTECTECITECFCSFPVANIRTVPEIRPSFLTQCALTFKSLLVTLRTTRFNVQKFCTLITLRLCVLWGSQNKQ
jgi:hypothetical protein